MGRKTIINQVVVVVLIIITSHNLALLDCGLAARSSSHASHPSVHQPTISHAPGQTNSPTDILLDIDSYVVLVTVIILFVCLCHMVISLTIAMLQFCVRSAILSTAFLPPHFQSQVVHAVV